MHKWIYVLLTGVVILTTMYVAAWWFLHDLDSIIHDDVEVGRITRMFPNGYHYDVVDKIRTAVGYGPSERISEEWYYMNYELLHMVFWPINRISFKVRSDVAPDEKIHVTE